MVVAVDHTADHCSEAGHLNCIRGTQTVSEGANLVYRTVVEDMLELEEDHRRRSHKAVDWVARTAVLIVP